MPLLFAATLFLSASLLFMVQPMVGKMVLPLLGGSPAVWNACMVFFQLLLLLGYQYAHLVTGKYAPRKQWGLHVVVLALPIAAFALATMLGARHSPIAIVEKLAPGGDVNPVFSVLALLTVAIAIPFFVVSTSAPLLQKWFGYTGHPSARDPYFLYAASNFGSLISLLGYPIVIEPNLSIVNQAWLFAGGFALLAVMIFACGRAAANPIGVPPPNYFRSSDKKQLNSGSHGSSGSGSEPIRNDRRNGNNGEVHPSREVATEPPPSLARKLKWIALAFVPSSLMLGVTFHMTTDIASIPLLWVGPLALYLLTFIIAFGRVPDWFRVVIGNLAPVMILLLVFVMISKVTSNMGILLLLHLITFFTAALMCHYELARDRPHPKYLTTFFLLMSVGGVLGGIFNSLIAPLIFAHDFEYKFVLVLACALVPRLTEDEETTEGTRLVPRLSPLRYLAFFIGGAVFAVVLLPLGALLVVALAVAALLVKAGVASQERIARLKGRVTGYISRAEMNALLDGVVPVALGAVYYFLRYLPGEAWYAQEYLSGPQWFKNLTEALVDKLTVVKGSVIAILTCAGPVMLCFFFVDRPFRFALCVLAILGYSTYRQTYKDGNNLIHSERSFFGILKVEEDERGYELGRRGGDGKFRAMLQSDGKPFDQRFLSRRLVHGTTLHGQQFRYLPGPDGRATARFITDDFQMLFPGANPLAAVTAFGTIQSYDEEQEPLTYYHRTGPVGAMYRELRSRQNGKDRDADVAMVGLGTGSVSCYAYPGQHLTFYEIDPAVEHLVSDQAHDGRDAFFTFVPAARARGAKVTIRMGDARLKLKEDEDRKYALLLVDAFSSDSIPVHLLTVEAVQLYFDRLTEDGLLAIHISNRWVRLEPVVSAIAHKLGVPARVWSDDGESAWGKTASSWIVLARKQEYLGKLNTPLGDLPFALSPDEHGDDRMGIFTQLTSDGLYQRYLWDSSLRALLISEFDELEEAVRTNQEQAVTRKQTLQDTLNQSRDPEAEWVAWTEAKYAELCDPKGTERPALFEKSATPFAYMEAYRSWLKGQLQTADTPLKQRVSLILGLLRKYRKEATLDSVSLHEHGHGFRRLETLTDVEAWTDDYADVMRVMDIPGLQPIRKFFGLPTPLRRN